MKLPYSMEKNKKVLIGLIIIGMVVSYVLYTVFAVTTITYGNGGKIAISGNTMTITYSNGRTFKTSKTIDIDGKLKLTVGWSPDAFSDECRKFDGVSWNDSTSRWVAGYIHKFTIDGTASAENCNITEITCPTGFGRGECGEPKISKFTDIAKLTEFAKSIGVK